MRWGRSDRGRARRAAVDGVRLWAPSAPPALALEIEGRAPIALRPGPDGYAQAIVDGAPGLRYRYRLPPGC
ncbi:early set domain-containing protein, partial [Bordetella pertussis]|uniref:hypothetical protein n=1 Tax=Bordetella pertussis TaxID=520 RepID=UPI0021CBF058